MSKGNVGEKIQLAFKKLSPTKNDVVAIIAPSSLGIKSLEVIAAEVTNILKEHNCAAVVLSEDCDVRLLDEEQMRLLGWTRLH